ncbi:MAG TPA: hypothetical protein VN706_08745 [Gemmatimonadaceae bacterium]|nr:hypothetical protein [Gemmatimonadaceae bacterium]
MLNRRRRCRISIIMIVRRSMKDLPPVAPPSVDAAAGTSAGTSVGTSPDEEGVNAVLAEQARTRGPSELWMTTMGGGVNAVLLWSQFPGLYWLAGAFTAMTAYGVWGLLDRSMSVLKLRNADTRAEFTFLKIMSTLAAVSGWAAALFAVASLLTTLVGGLSMPGR